MTYFFPDYVTLILGRNGSWDMVWRTGCYCNLCRGHWYPLLDELLI